MESTMTGESIKGRCVLFFGGTPNQQIQVYHSYATKSCRTVFMKSSVFELGDDFARYFRQWILRAEKNTSSSFPGLKFVDQKYKVSMYLDTFFLFPKKTVKMQVPKKMVNNTSTLSKLWLVGGLEHLDYFSIEWGIILPTDELIFFRGVGIPPTNVLPYYIFQ